KVSVKGSEVGFALSRIEKLLELKPELRKHVLHCEKLKYEQTLQQSQIQGQKLLSETRTSPQPERSIGEYLSLNQFKLLEQLMKPEKMPETAPETAQQNINQEFLKKKKRK